MYELIDLRISSSDPLSIDVVGFFSTLNPLSSTNVSPFLISLKPLIN